MAEYNFINSTENSDLVTGTENNDSIKVYGNHSTVQALGGNDVISVNGGRHDSGIWLEGDESNVVSAGTGNDSIGIYSRGASVYGGSGNDTIDFNKAHAYADGGACNDLFYLNRNSTYYDMTDITITGGEGKDTLEIVPYSNNGIEIVVTDFSNDDVLRLDENHYTYSTRYSSHRVITQEVQNGNVVISDNSSVGSYGGDIITQTVTPKFSITLQGVSDISEIADAKCYLYNYNTPKDYKTFGELFGTSKGSATSSATVAPDIETSTNVTSTTTKKTETTTTTEETTTKSVETPTSSTSGGTVINNYYGDTYNVNDNNGTVVIGSSVTGDVNNNTTVDNSTTIIKYGNTYTYNGGDKVINNYQQGEVVRLDSDYQGIDLNGNSFFVKSSSGQLEIQNSRNKFIGYSAGNSEVIAYSYVASGNEDVDGRGKSQAEIMIGGDNVNNQMFAGSGGSSMWGGNGGEDTLTGGEGYDEFFYAIGSGNDMVQSADSNDMINLLGVSLSQISSFSYDSSSVNLQFNDGGNLRIEGTSMVGYRVENTTYAFNHATGEWITK